MKHWERKPCVSPTVILAKGKSAVECQCEEFLPYSCGRLAFYFGRGLKYMCRQQMASMCSFNEFIGCSGILRILQRWHCHPSGGYILAFFLQVSMTFVHFE